MPCRAVLLFATLTRINSLSEFSYRRVQIGTDCSSRGLLYRGCGGAPSRACTSCTARYGSVPEQGASEAVLLHLDHVKNNRAGLAASTPDASAHCGPTIPGGSATFSIDWIISLCTRSVILLHIQSLVSSTTMIRRGIKIKRDKANSTTPGINQNMVTPHCQTPWSIKYLLRLIFFLDRPAGDWL